MTDELVKGKTVLSCGHEDEHGCMGVSVQFDDEQCIAGEGFVPTTVYAQYCHECATKLYYEIGKDAGRIEADLQADLIEQQAARIAALEAFARNAERCAAHGLAGDWSIALHDIKRESRAALEQEP